jgi:hypothetical protein
LQQLSTVCVIFSYPRSIVNFYCQKLLKDFRLTVREQVAMGFQKFEARADLDSQHALHEVALLAQATNFSDTVLRMQLDVLVAADARRASEVSELNVALASAQRASAVADAETIALRTELQLLRASVEKMQQQQREVEQRAAHELGLAHDTAAALQGELKVTQRLKAS